MTLPEHALACGPPFQIQTNTMHDDEIMISTVTDLQPQLGHVQVASGHRLPAFDNGALPGTTGWI